MTTTVIIGIEIETKLLNRIEKIAKDENTTINGGKTNKTNEIEAIKCINLVDYYDCLK